MADDEKARGFDLVPVLVLAGLVVLGLLGWWLYPRLQQFMSVQDCIATGRTNCS
jgi:hypothetical protein